VPANVDMLVNALRGEHQLSVALNGEGALRSIEKLNPDLVLLDIIMPGMDGYEVCSRMRASPRTRDIPVMFLSSLEDAADKAKGFEAGGNDYLVKPFEIIEVKARVRSLLRAKAYADSVKEKIAYDLRIAKEIQVGILPADVASAGLACGIEAHAILQPAQEVGGDLYELLRTPAGKLIAVIGDVSGKGIPAALFMAVTTTLVRGLAPSAEGPRELLRYVSDGLVSHNPRNMFVTLLCATYQAESGQLAYASAGHPAPVLVRGGNATFLAVEPELAAGIVGGISPVSQSIDLQEGDAVVFYTDGVTEAFNDQGCLYGEARLLEALMSGSARTAEETAAVLLQSVREHAGNHPQSDDIAILVLKRT
jgi:sigma-B regulation protein RsbU (phosphoserine phosphatase)